MRLLLALPLLLASPALGDGGRVNNLKVLSDKVDDVTTVEQIVKSFVKPGMTDQQRAEALWRAAVKYRHQQVPANEYLDGDEHPHDPVKVFNVYGYCQCCCSSAILEALNREDGREARGRILNGHSVPEVRYRDAWHMFDASLITYFPRPDDEVAASVDEIASSVADWYVTHPDYHKNGAKILDLMRKDGWMGWKAEGPRLLAHCPFYKLGYLPARTHGWDATMAEYDRKPEVFEYGYQVGHRALFSLRPGESFVREAGNRGLHVSDDPNWDGLKARVPENDLAYVPEFDPGYRGGVVGNGKHIYAPNFATGDLERGAEVFENLATGPDGVKVKDRRKPGMLVVEMKSPYVYLGGLMHFTWDIPADATGRARVSISTDGGRSFVRTGIGGSQTTIGTGGKLEPYIARRYAYRIKVDLVGGARLTDLRLNNDIQHAPRTLPRLEKGKNTITVAVGLDPTLATRTITGRIAAEPGFDKNQTAESMGVTFDNLNLEHNACWWKGGTGVMTVPIDVPGDLVSLGFSAMIRARDEKDRVRAATSVDGGKTWREVAILPGPTQGRTHHVRVADWPAGVRKAMLRFELTGNNTVGVQSFRVDADYRDPLAARSPGRFTVLHRWKEGDEAREHAQTITTLPTSYTIEGAADPEMISVTYQMDAGR
jgi:hypothetical protein